jgi:hypothetical protein
MQAPLWLLVLVTSSFWPLPQRSMRLPVFVRIRAGDVLMNSETLRGLRYHSTGLFLAKNRRGSLVDLLRLLVAPISVTHNRKSSDVPRIHAAIVSIALLVDEAPPGPISAELTSIWQRELDRVLNVEIARDR